jgi:integrase
MLASPWMMPCGSANSRRAAARAASGPGPGTPNAAPGPPSERRGREAGVDVYPHKFRHTFSHNWLDNGGAEGDLMELNGWSSPQMLARYGRSARSARARRHYDDVMRG